MQAKIAYQLYSARDEASKDLRSILKTLRQQGYEGVEFAGFYGHSAVEIKALLEETGLEAASSHVPLALMKEDPFGVLSFHQKIGCKYIAIPYLEEKDRPGAPGFAGVIRFIYSFARLCRKAGIQLCYHNHDFEFERVSGVYGLDFLYEAVPANLLMTELDTCWVKYAGVDPASYLKQYSGRAPVVHIKDFVGFKGEVSPYHLIGLKDNPDAAIAQFSYRPFGHGVQDAKGVVESALSAGARWLIIEQDESPDRPPMAASAMSIATLKQLGM
ncbi:MAG: sugar phosphate isomerase/epimerase family protein [Christensenellales bacterium]